MPHIGPLGLPELIIILLVILVIFGPKNLPKLGKAIGRTVKNLREGMDSGKDEKDEADEAEATEAKVEEVTEEVKEQAEEKPAEAEDKAE